jgi:anti-sigma B factor antagonist
MSSERDGDVVVVSLTGDFVARTAGQFKALNADYTGKNVLYLVLDLSQVTFIDSSGLGECIILHKWFQARGGLVVFAKPSEAVAKLFRVTRADEKLRIAPTRQAAVQSAQEFAAGKAP